MTGSNNNLCCLELSLRKSLSSAVLVVLYFLQMTFSEGKKKPQMRNVEVFEVAMRRTVNEFA